jgi:hypothetical protein
LHLDFLTSLQKLAAGGAPHLRRFLARANVLR